MASFRMGLFGLLSNRFSWVGCRTGMINTQHRENEDVGTHRLSIIVFFVLLAVGAKLLSTALK